MTEMEKPTPVEQPQKKGRAGLLVKLGLFLFLVLLVLLTFWMSQTLFPRKWADFIGDQADGTMWRATTYGLVIGFFFTFVPLVIARQALRGFKLGVRITILLVAVLLALPNLLTLAIMLGNGRSFEVARRTLDDDAAGFRVGSVCGAVVAGLLFAMLVFWTVARWNDKRKLRKLTTDLAAEVREQQD